jgi:hypothetical protein
MRNTPADAGGARVAGNQPNRKFIRKTVAFVSSEHALERLLAAAQ